MSEAVLLRPGIATGFYPEREEERESWLDRTASAIWGTLFQRFGGELLGGWAMVRGKGAEMETGEGKTLTATLPAATAALAGIPVHIITVNDFLAARDAAWMKPLYDALGLSVGTALEGMSPAERRHAYGCSITYCTHKQGG